MNTTVLNTRGKADWLKSVLNAIIVKSGFILSKIYTAVAENNVILAVKTSVCPRLSARLLFSHWLFFVLIKLVVLVNDFHSHYGKLELKFYEDKEVCKGLHLCLSTFPLFFFIVLKLLVPQPLFAVCQLPPWAVPQSIKNLLCSCRKPQRSEQAKHMVHDFFTLFKTWNAPKLKTEHLSRWEFCLSKVHFY